MPAGVSRAPRAPSVLSAAAIVALCLGLWILPWTIWPMAPRAKSAAGTKIPLQVRYVRAAQGLDETAWSPVVFPLPTKYGFSEKADAQGGLREMEAVLRPRIADSALLPAPAEPAAPARLLPPTNPRPGTFMLEPVEKPAYSVSRSRTDSGTGLDVSDSLALRNFRVPALAGVTCSVPLSAYVELDEAGRVQHVFLESSSGSKAADQAALRALRAAEAEPGKGAVIGRVWFIARESVPE